VLKHLQAKSGAMGVGGQGSLAGPWPEPDDPLLGSGLLKSGRTFNKKEVVARRNGSAWIGSWIFGYVCVSVCVCVFVFLLMCVFP
jgi:hypothetical protein